MNHDEFMRTLCTIISSFSMKLSNDPGPCFCGKGNDVAKLEIAREMWCGSHALLHCLAEKLEVEFPKEK